MRCHNSLKHVVLYVLVIIQMVAAGEGNKCSQEILKSNLSCPSSEKWTLLIPPYVYVTRNYNPTINPNAVKYDACTIIFQNIEILEVDEMKKEVTLALSVFMIWIDNRIKVLQPSNDFAITLPPITDDNHIPLIWTTHNKFSTINLRNRRYLQSPTIMNVYLLGRDTANKLFEADNFLGNTSTVFVGIKIEWGLTIRCPFIFAHFPFDQNVCVVKMRFENMSVKFAEQKFMYFEDYIPKIVDGFITKIKNLAPIKQEHPKLDIYWSDIGFKISMKRQVGKYIYQYYLPCFAIVITSSFSFIIPLSAIPGRVSLIVTLFLTLTNIFIVQMVRDMTCFYQ